jgi:hypothetical protein
MKMIIRPATEADRAAVLDIVGPVLRAGETYAIDTDLTDAQMLDYWFMPAHEVLVMEDEGRILGTWLRAKALPGACANIRR